MGPSSSFECASLIMKHFSKNITLRKNFMKSVSILKTRYPTRHNQNKFMLGMGIEYLFVNCFNKYSECNDVVSLCRRNETRNDITMCDFPFSLKYTTPNTSGSLLNLRLINKHTNRNNKEYHVGEDTFIIVPNVSKQINPANILNPQTNRMQKKNTPLGKKLIDEYGEEFLDIKTKKKLGGKLIYVPKNVITENDLRFTSDGIELKSLFLNKYVNDDNNINSVVPLDIHTIEDMDEFDIIRIGIEDALGYKLEHC